MCHCYSCAAASVLTIALFLSLWLNPQLALSNRLKKEHIPEKERNLNKIWNGIFHKWREAARQDYIFYPHVFLIGVDRMTTSNIYDLLISHEEICIGPVREANFFHVNSNWQRGKAWYMSLMKSSNNCTGRSLTIDYSPTMIHSDLGLARMARSTNPDEYKGKKIVIVLRDPVQLDARGYQKSVRACAESIAKVLSNGAQPQKMSSEASIGDKRKDLNAEGAIITRKSGKQYNGINRSSDSIIKRGMNITTASLYGFRKETLCIHPACSSVGCGDMKFSDLEDATRFAVIGISDPTQFELSNFVDYVAQYLHPRKEEEAHRDGSQEEIVSKRP